MLFRSVKFATIMAKEFAGDLGAKKSMPGGGSAAAYAATMANSLAMMVANFTLGKKKYADYEEDIVRILDRAQKMSEDVMSLCLHLYLYRHSWQLL